MLYTSILGYLQFCHKSIEIPSTGVISLLAFEIIPTQIEHIKSSYILLLHVFQLEYTFQKCR